MPTQALPSGSTPSIFKLDIDCCFQSTNFSIFRGVLKLDFAKETVLITGASSGLGEAMSLRFSELGAKVVMLARREKRLLQLQKILKNDSFYVAIDISDTEKVANLPRNIHEW